MRTTIRSILVSLLFIVAAPAYSESLEAIQIFRCEFNDANTEEEAVLDLAEAWLKAAKKTPGGKNMTLAVRFPVAVGVVSVADFTWVISVPTFTEWGQFTDAYEDSEVADIDDKLFDDLAECGDSTMWEGVIMN
jgi:hypothetical protein